MARPKEHEPTVSLDDFCNGRIQLTVEPEMLAGFRAHAVISGFANLPEREFNDLFNLFTKRQLPRE